MKFNNGYFGACICVLALLGTASCGFFLNIEKDTREVTNYNYTADVSGLFSYTDAPEYIDYNPSSNLNGYDDNVVYTPSNVVNNYPYAVQRGETVPLSSFTFTNNSNLPNDYGPWQGNSNVRFVGFNDNAPLPFNEYVLDNNKATKLSNVLNAMNLSEYETVSLDISQGQYPVYLFHENWGWSQDYGQDTGYYMGYTESSSELVYPRQWVVMDRILPTHIDVEITSYICSVYNGSTLLYTDTADNIGFLAWYSWRNSDPMTPIHRDTSITFSGTGIEPTIYSYMNPLAGIKATTTESTWENGYSNGVIDLKIIKNGDESVGTGQIVNLSIPKNNYLGTWFLLQFIYNNSGFHVQYNDGTHHMIDLGGWLGVQVRIDALNGDVILTPTNDLNLLTTVQPTDYSTVIEDCIDGQTKTSFKVSAYGSAPSLKFQVTDTKVFLNTYNTVMVDPTLNIADYFPGYTEYRLNFYSFAILGDSMTINNQVCPVNSENGTITFRNVADIEFTKKLANIYLTFQDGHTYLTFVNDSSVYDLGETVNTVVSFSGMWYFTTGLYKAVDGMESFWNLDLDGMFHATAGECLLIFIGIIALGTIVYTVWGRGKLGTYDWIVIIFSIFLGSCLLGF